MLNVKLYKDKLMNDAKYLEIISTQAFEMCSTVNELEKKDFGEIFSQNLFEIISFLQK
jgi:hypothetical protein